MNLIAMKDIDECDAQSVECSDICINTPGSFHCFCEDGYALGNDSLTCFGKLNIL